MPHVVARAFHHLHHRGIQVLLVIVLYFLFAQYLPDTVHRGFYTISVCMKDLLLWMLPCTVGAFIAHTTCSFERRAPIFILVLFAFEAVSNLASVWYAYGCGHAVQCILPTISMQPSDHPFNVLWSFPFSRPAWWSAEKGVVAGLVIGCIGAFVQKKGWQRGVAQAKRVAEIVLTKIFSPLIPFFVLGFVARMYQTKILHDVISHYGLLVLCLVVFLLCYFALLLLIGNGWSVKRAYAAGLNLVPAGGLAFTSGCSLSTMPWTIEGTSKNLDQPELARAVIPATTNIQQIGDCITNSFLCFLIYQQFFGHCPDMATWLSFSAVFVLARYYTAAVLGGAIFIMLPIYESYLSFNSEMIAIILAFNVILDPIVTSTNVLSNGALCRIFELVWAKIPGASNKAEERVS
jgi:hypothetical protein